MTPDEKIKERQKADFERRMKKVERDAALGRKKMSEQLTDEAVQQTVDWVELGGLSRLWTVLKVVTFVFVSLIAVAVIVLLDS